MNQFAGRARAYGLSPPGEGRAVLDWFWETLRLAPACCPYSLRTGVEGGQLLCFAGRERAFRYYEAKSPWNLVNTDQFFFQTRFTMRL
jgi:hypothetical protein